MRTKTSFAFGIGLSNVVYFNTSGNAGMATAGSGDVLTGIVAALLAQKTPPRDAASLGAFIHGLSGEIMAKDLTAYSLMAKDLIAGLPKSFSKLSNITKLA